jgi:tetratricopeptide (TPR) repeat protein
MNVLQWWRKRRARRRTSNVAQASIESAIAARVDMVRLEAYAEAAYDAMYEARLYGAKDRYEDARRHFDRAIEAAQRAGLHEEATRLKRRRDHVSRVYNSQFRFSGG